MVVMLTRAAPNPRRPRWRRGFDVVQLLVVVALLGVLAAVAFSAFVQPVEDVSRSYLRQSLTSVDVELRQRARAGQSTDVTVWFDQVVGVPGEVAGCPEGGVIAVPSAECGDDVPDGERFWLEAGDSSDGPAVTLVRFGRCERLLVDADGVAAGELVGCDPDEVLGG